MNIFGCTALKLTGVAVAALAIALWCPVENAFAQQTVDRVVASVDGDPITARDVAQFSSANGHPVTGNDISDSPAAKQALKELIVQMLLRNESQKYSSKIDSAQIDHYIDQIRQDQHLSPDQFKAAIAQSGMSDQEFREKARQQLEAAMMMQQQVRDRVEIPDAEIQSYYDAHKADYTVTKERYRLSQILIGVPANATPQQVAMLHAKAEKIRVEAVKGADFTDLARKYSDDVSRNNGGELGWFAPADIMDQILTAVRLVKVGGVTSVVRSSHGFHILKVEAHEIPGLRPLSEVRDSIRERLIDLKAKSETQEWVETDLAKHHDVETLY